MEAENQRRYNRETIYDSFLHPRAWRDDYTPFGEKRLDPLGNRDKAGLTGHIDDAATGLTYMQARYYDPNIGRFLSKDPVDFAAGGIEHFNRYAYVGNDPANGIDPSGMDAVDIREIVDEAKAAVVEQVSDMAEAVRDDVVDFAEAVLDGDFEYAFGGMPPTLSGGARIVPAAAQGINTARASVITPARMVTAEIQAARVRTIPIMKANRGANTRLRELWNSNANGVRRALARSDLAAPTGISREAARVYRDTLRYQVARGIDESKPLMVEVSRLRLQILDRIGL